MRTPDKWDRFGTSIFSVMTQKANQAQAVNLAQGFPDFDGPSVIKEAAIDAIRSGLNQYAPAPGLPSLRQLLATRQEQRTGLKYSWEDEVTVFSGATEAIYCAFQALFSPGDEIIAFEPFYDSYSPAAFAAGAQIVGVPLMPPNWDFEPESIAKKITPKTRAIIVNTPHNPTGRVFSRAELEAISALVKKHDLWVITDEVYEELIYSLAAYLSPASLPGMAERTILISSTAKTYSFTGWKIGYAFAPKLLTKGLRAVHQFTVFCSATPLQRGMEAALKLAPSYYDELRREYGMKRDLLLTILKGAGFKPRAPEGTYFILADFSTLSRKSDVEFSLWLTEKAKVAVVPISVFYTDPIAAQRETRHVRFAFCKGFETIRQAKENLRLMPELGCT